MSDLGQVPVVSYHVTSYTCWLSCCEENAVWIPMKKFFYLTALAVGSPRPRCLHAWFHLRPLHLANDHHLAISSCQLSSDVFLHLEYLFCPNFLLLDKTFELVATLRTNLNTSLKGLSVNTVRFWGLES